MHFIIEVILCRFCISVENLAVKKPSYQSSTYYGSVASRANDGKDDTYSRTGSVTMNNYWFVDLQQYVSIYNVVFQLAKDTQFTTINVYVGVTNNTWDLCRNIDKPPMGKPISVTCDVNNKGRFLKIERVEFGALILFDVAVYGNIAKRKYTYE